ncbi:MAG TPA: VanZ family protein [Terriglobales bacterium]|nr:VanZ family protein [Terriglobales bacterium]
MFPRILKAWLPVAAMCVVIFLFSQDSHSARHSNEVLGWILTLFGINTPHFHHLFDYPFRKFAHVVVYTMLGALSYRGFALGQRTFSPAAAVRTLIFSAAYAASDEIHQGFTQYRGATVHDVVLDTAAASLALFVIWLFTRKSRTRRPMVAAISSSD